METKAYQKIKVSHTAYLKIKALAASDEYRGRGIVGVIDKMVLGDFTTNGSGRPKNLKKDEKIKK